MHQVNPISKSHRPGTPRAGSWDDNINLSKADPLQDFILLPTLGLDMSYPNLPLWAVLLTLQGTFCLFGAGGKEAEPVRWPSDIVTNAFPATPSVLAPQSNVPGSVSHVATNVAQPVSTNSMDARDDQHRLAVGDVDLLVVSDTLSFREVLRLRTGILERIGWQQLDLVVRRRDQLDEPLAAMAQETGLKL